VERQKKEQKMKRSELLSKLGLGPIYVFEGPTDIALGKLMRQISAACDGFMDKNGGISPMYHIVCRAGFHLVIDAPSGDKDEIVAKVRALLKAADAVAYAFCDEAWTASYNSDEIKAGRIDVLPVDRPNREEIVLIQGESEREGELTGTRKIIQQGKKRMLGPLELDRWTGSTGRMVGLLPRRGPVQ
jgi:hypothetical protein